MLADDKIEGLINQDYDSFVKIIVKEIGELSFQNNLIEELLKATTNEEIKSDLREVLSEIRQDKINSILDEE